jgi:hypothetical protein
MEGEQAVVGIGVEELLVKKYIIPIRLWSRVPSQLMIPGLPAW